MSYIALKPCTLQGKTYLIDDVIPADAVLPSAAASLIRRGYIASTPDSPAKPAPAPDDTAQFTLIFDSDKEAGGKILLTVTESDLQQAGDIMRMGAEDAQAAVQSVVSVRALRYVLALDGRKTIESAVRKRLAEIGALSDEESVS